MNRAAITIAAILLSVGSATAQESKGDLSKDHPNLEWPQASIQPYSLNFEMPKFIEQKDTASTATAIQLNSPTFGRKLQLEPEAPKFRFNQNPYAFDFNTSGAIATWDNGALIGAGNRTTLPGLYSNQQASFSAVQQFGDLTLSAGVSADRYQMFQGPTGFAHNSAYTATCPTGSPTICRSICLAPTIIKIPFIPSVPSPT